MIRCRILDSRFPVSILLVAMMLVPAWIATPALAQQPPDDEANVMFNPNFFNGLRFLNVGRPEVDDRPR